jgi:hypothetical protein
MRFEKQHVLPLVKCCAVHCVVSAHFVSMRHVSYSLALPTS